MIIYCVQQFEFRIMSIEKNSKDLPQKFTLSNFIILNRLGRGSTAHVFKVQSIKTHQFYAMKVIDKKCQSISLSHIQSQVKIHQTLNHPHIIDLIAYFQDHENYYMLTEYCQEGETTKILLHDHLREQQEMFQNKIKQIAYEVTLALFYLHEEMGVFHGDLKLGNILMSHGKIKLCDFGFSKNIQDFYESSKIRTEEGDVKGTLMYLPPEIIRQQKILYPKSMDIWGLGISLLVLILRGNPYQFTSTQQLKKQISNGSWKRPQNFHNQSLINLLQRMLEINPSQRISAGEILKHQLFCPKFSEEDEICQKQNQCDHTIDSLSSIKQAELTQMQEFQKQAIKSSQMQKICTVNLQPQEHFMKNKGFIKVESDKSVTIRINKTIFKIDSFGENIYVEYIKKEEDTQLKRKLKKFRFECLKEESNEKILRLYEYGRELVNLLKKKSGIINQGWMSKNVLMWQKKEKENRKITKLAFLTELNIRIRFQKGKNDKFEIFTEEGSLGIRKSNSILLDGQLHPQFLSFVKSGIDNLRQRNPRRKALQLINH